jgi:hypothetical protein
MSQKAIEGLTVLTSDTDYDQTAVDLSCLQYSLYLCQFGKIRVVGVISEMSERVDVLSQGYSVFV